MGFFGKKRNKNEDFKIQLEREALEKLNNNEFTSTIPFKYEEVDSTVAESGHSKMHSASMITAEEILGKNSALKAPSAPPSETPSEEKISMSSNGNSSGAAEFLFKRMTEARNTTTEKTVLNDNITEVKESIKESPVNSTPTSPETKKAGTDLNTLLKELRKDAERFSAGMSRNNASVEDELTENNTKETAVKQPENTAKKVNEVPPAVSKPEMKSAEERRATLLARCNAYLQDEEFGTLREVNTEKYKLESVESILKSMEEKASQRVRKTHSSGYTAVTEQTAVSSAKKADANRISTTSISLSDVLKAVSEMPAEQPTHENKTETVNDDNTTQPQETVKHHTFDTEKFPSEKKDNEKTIVLDYIPDSPANKDTESTGSTQIFKTVQVKINHMQPADKELFSSSQSADTDETDNNFALSEIEDYNSIKDKERVLTDLKKERFKFIRTSFANFILLVLSVLLVLPLSSFVKGFGINSYHLSSLLLLLLASAVNYDIFKSVSDAFKSKYNNDFALFSSTAAVTVYTLVQLLTTSDSVTLAPIVILTLFITSIGKGSRIKRILGNFLCIADENTKEAITILNNKAATKEMVGKAIDGNALICLGTKTVNIKDFLKYSYSTDPNSKKIRLVTIAGLICSVIAFIITAAVTAGDFLSALRSAVIILCITAAPSITFLTDLPIKSAQARLSCYGAILTGYRAADRFDHCNAIALDCNSLFPNGTVRLVDMKPLSNNPVYQSIIEAIAITEQIGSPLAGMFRQAIDVPNDSSLKVDTVVYEDKMGISGWVNDKRVFIGNRILMESHGITNIPAIELDKKIMRKGYFPIYLASENKPCVMFVVRYIADDEITYELRRLCNTGTTVLVKNCDPNISASMLCDYFGLYKDSISLMSKQGAEQYNLVTAKKESCSAGALYGKSVCGLLATLTASIGIKKMVSLTSALYVLCTVLGLLITVVASLLNYTSIFTPLNLLIFQVASLIIPCLPALIKRP